MNPDITRKTAEPQEWRLGRRDDNYTIVTEACEVVIGFGSVAKSRAEVLIDAHNATLHDTKRMEDYKWLDPDCMMNGCQSLKFKGGKMKLDDIWKKVNNELSDEQKLAFDDELWKSLRLFATSDKRPCRHFCELDAEHWEKAYEVVKKMTTAERKAAHDRVLRLEGAIADVMHEQI